MYTPGSSAGHEAEHQLLRSQMQAQPLAVTSLPAAASNTGQQVIYQNILWYSDGTQWLSLHLYREMLIGKNASNVAPAPGAGGFVIASMAMASDYDILITKLSLTMQHFTSQSTVNFYTISATGLTLSGTTDTKANTGAPGTQYRIEPTFTPAVRAKTNTSFDVNFQQSGAPGNLEIMALVQYRLVD